MSLEYLGMTESQKKTQHIQNTQSGEMSMGHSSQLKELPMAKEGIF